MKGIVPLIELAVTAALLFVTFGLLFPRFVYVTKWEDAKLLVLARDIALSLDRVGELYGLSFNSTAFQEFAQRLFPVPEFRVELRANEALQPKLWITCNCTQEQLDSLNEWFDGLRLNGRRISVEFCWAELTSVDSCRYEDVDTHGAILLGYKQLSNALDVLLDMIEDGKGIVELVDFTGPEQVDEAQGIVFGLEWSEATPEGNVSWPRLPVDSADVIYGVWKHFYGVPLQLKSSYYTPPIAGCQDLSPNTGSFEFRDVAYEFWLCDPGRVYFDSDRDGSWESEDLSADVGQAFSLNDTAGSGFNFTLSYVDGIWIGISFDPAYEFENFIGTSVAPLHNELQRILLLDELGVSGSIANGSKVVWTSDLLKDGLKDDERLYLISTLLWTSSKKAPPPMLPAGYSVSYLNIRNLDMLEIYEVELGISRIF
jgi:hypothetical protein